MIVVIQAESTLWQQTLADEVFKLNNSWRKFINNFANTIISTDDEVKDVMRSWTGQKWNLFTGYLQEHNQLDLASKIRNFVVKHLPSDQSDDVG